MDWQSSRVATYRYVRVNPSDLEEIGEVEGFEDGGSIERNQLISLKVSGSANYYLTPDIGNDYLRVYADIKQGTERLSLPLGTFLVSMPQATLKYGAVKGTADLLSVLQVLADTVAEQTLTVDIGDNPVDRAKEIVLDSGLQVTSDDSDFTLNIPKTYNADVDKLEIVNDLLAVAGFDSARVDAMGRVVFRRYNDPSTISPSITFTDGDNCVFAPEVDYEFDTYSVPNRLVAVMSNEEACMTAIVTNDDPVSIYSTVNRGRVVTAVETVSDIDSQDDLGAYALRMLISKSSAVESIEFTHPYQPFEEGDGVKLIYGDFEFVGVAVKISMTESPAMVCKTRVRRFVRM
jgi:hypothetical protein